MEAHPPYLFDPASAQLTVTADGDGAVLDIAVRGAWDDESAGAVRQAVHNCLAEHPAAIVIDLTRADGVPPETAGMWLAMASAAAAGDPPARLALCLPAERGLADRLRRTGAAELLPLFASDGEAHAALAGRRSLADVVRLRLPPTTVAPSVARNLVGGACQAWNLADLLHPGRAVMSELVTNAVEHARTDMEVSISRRGAALHLAVRDRSPALPRVISLATVRPGEPLNERGKGLRVVHADSLAWGAIPTTGGKMVWATIRSRGGRPRQW